MKSSRHKKTPALAGEGVSGNEFNYQEEIVMSDITTAVSNVIPFRDNKLLLVEKDGQPYVPMKPVVEGMGLDWKSQYAKLQGGRFNSVVVMITTTGADGKSYLMSCLPLRKLAGWLMSIHSSKVRIDLRDNVLAYQNECDDALWSYWNEGLAVNSLTPGQGMTLIGQTIGTDGFHMLGSLIKGKVSRLPTASRRSVGAKIWSQTHAAFGVRSAEDIPAEQLDSARNFIAAYCFEGEYLPKDEGLLNSSEPGKRYMVAFNHRGERTVEEISSDAYVLSQHDLIKGMTASPGDIMVATDDMFDFAIAAIRNLKSRSMYARRKSA